MAGKFKGLTQAYELQDYVFDACMALKRSQTQPDGQLKITREDAQAINALVRSWESAQERIRIHRNKPMPGSLRPERKVKAKRSVEHAGSISRAALRAAPAPAEQQQPTTQVDAQQQQDEHEQGEGIS